MDVLIGTHRVLSRDVVPKDLGLVVVDEEQRFGVAQKELLRQLRLEVDVLALSATPIPRTLHLSLAGLRDISVIETPPQGRRPIRTHVGEYDEELLPLALERETERGGQSFYLHNRVETIDECGREARQLCPSCASSSRTASLPSASSRSACSHSSAGDADVLVSTTIIESGLDIPQANTLIVERADMLGLAQLYQIRGRVGRSDVVAHAYLFYPDSRELTAGGASARSPRSPITPSSAQASRSRCGTWRSGGPATCSAASSRVTSRRSASSFMSSCSARRSPSSAAPGERSPAGPGRRPGRCLHPGGVHRCRGCEDRPPPAYRARRVEDELRELRAARGGSLRPDTEPVEHLFAIQEAKLKLARLGADYLVFAAGERP